MQEKKNCEATENCTAPVPFAVEVGNLDAAETDKNLGLVEQSSQKFEVPEVSRPVIMSCTIVSEVQTSDAVSVNSGELLSAEKQAQQNCELSRPVEQSSHTSVAEVPDHGTLPINSVELLIPIETDHYHKQLKWKIWKTPSVSCKNSTHVD